jgi:CubicO group peptidase (beta-lactamase class C family)
MFRKFSVAAILFAIGTLPSLTQDKPPSNPGTDWVSVSPETEGFSSAKLEILRAWLKTEPTHSMMVVANGKVIFSYGDVAHVSKINSVRKSILSMLLGKYVVSGKIDMYKTVEQLGLDDKIPFTPLEQRATLEQLMTARSGIYRDLPSDDATSQQPSRGSVYPGTFFSYNNWEFDAAGAAFEKITGQNIYDALQTDLAIPLGMQDFHRDLQHKIPEPASNFPEYAMYLSTRDMARIGLLMLNYGVWNGKPILSRDWVRYSVSIITPWEEMEPPLLRMRGNPDRWGFGAGWWVWDAAPFPGNITGTPFQGTYEARGTGGQYITVIPARGLVLIHKTDFDADPHANLTDWPNITSMVLASTCPKEGCPPAPNRPTH